MDLLIDHHGGCQTAGTQAGDRLHGEHHVVGGVLLLAQTQLLPEGLQHGGGVAHMAGGAVAHLDHVFSLGFKGKVFIEGGHAVGFCFGNADLFRNIGQQLTGQVAVFRLNILHDRDQRLGLLAVAGDDLVCFPVVGFIQHSLFLL